MPGEKILIVDDEPFNVDYLEQELEDLNYSIITAVNGQDALNKILSEPPDLILLDIMMPVMDGFEVLARLKANPATRDLPVIVISANNDLHSVVRGIQLGADDYLPKPFEPTLLCARIASSLEKKHLRDLQHLYLKGLERELDIAREIQLGFLPSDLPSPEGWEVAAYLKAAREVAGDFYDAFLLPDASLAFVVGDVCGKGVGAALFMTLFRSLIRITATTDAFSTSKEIQSFTPTDRLQHIVSFTNNYVSGTHAAANMFATVFIGIVDLQTGTLNYINCGNESPLLLRNGSVVACLPPTGPVIGVIPDAKYTVQSIQLEQDDLLLAFTDGIPDAINAQNTAFGSERLYHALNGQNTTSELILNLVEDSLSRFIGTTDQFDDITLMAVKRCA